MGLLSLLPLLSLLVHFLGYLLLSNFLLDLLVSQELSLFSGSGRVPLIRGFLCFSISIMLSTFLTEAADEQDNHEDYADKADSGNRPPEPSNVADVVGFAVVGTCHIVVVAVV